MEKISIRPHATDIVIDAASANELNEVFSYNYGTNAGGSEDDIRRLGSLFIVGQMQPRNEDTSYVLNLVASLAKREYYLPSNETPKEAFNKTLKKINEALDGFFKDKDLKVNIGVFSIAGETVLVSKLGKFKMLLARKDAVIDVLNNIGAFDKEQVKETKFSSIISGKVSPGETLFAYYPSRSALAREKSIRTALTSAQSGKELSDAFQAIRSEKDSFSLAAVHLAIATFKEPAVAAAPQPAELKPKRSASSRKTITIPAPDPVPHHGTTPPVIQVAVHEGEDETGEPIAIRTESPPAPVTPLIIPSEFGMAKKPTLFSTIGSVVGLFIRTLTHLGGARMATKSVAFILSIALLVGLAYGMRAVLFDRTGNTDIDTALDGATMNVKLAKTKINQNEVPEARQLLSASLLSVLALDLSEPATAAARDEILAVLNEIDKATPATPNLVMSLDPATHGRGTHLAVAGDTLVTLTDTHTLVVKQGDQPERSIFLEHIQPNYLFGLDGKVVLLDTVNKKLGITTLSDGATKITEQINFPDGAIDYYLYEANLYGMTENTIVRIIDAANGKSVFGAWFSDTTNLPPSPKLLAVDGDIFVFDHAGTATKYFKGEKISELATPVIPDEHTRLLTHANAPVFTLIQKALGRIYAVRKDTGVLEKVMTLSNSAPITSSALGSDQVLYLLTADNKVWKLTP